MGLITVIIEQKDIGNNSPHLMLQIAMRRNNGAAAYVVDGFESFNELDLGGSEVHDAAFDSVHLRVVPEHVRTPYHLRVVPRMRRRQPRYIARIGGLSRQRR